MWVWDIVIKILLFYGLLIGALFLGKKMVKTIREKKLKNTIRKKIEETWNKVNQTREMKAIEKENAEALRNIKSFLKDRYSDYQFLNEVMVPEFNCSAPPAEHLPINLPDKKLRKAILEKAEEYNTTSNPLLEILAESFTTTHKRLKK